MKLAVIALATVVSTAAIANDKFVFEKDPTYTGAAPRVHVKTNGNGGLILDGQNASGTPLTVQHVKDGNQKGVVRHPIVHVRDKHNRTAIEQVLPSLEVEAANDKAVSITLGEEKNHWAFIVTKDNQLMLRRTSKHGNRTDHRFYRVAGQEVCDERLVAASATDVQDIAGNDFNYSFGNKNVVRSCHDAYNGNPDIEFIQE